jgi:hypothetical protein
MEGRQITCLGLVFGLGMRCGWACAVNNACTSSCQACLAVLTPQLPVLAKIVGVLVRNMWASSYSLRLAKSLPNFPTSPAVSRNPLLSFRNVVECSAATPEILHATLWLGVYAMMTTGSQRTENERWRRKESRSRVSMTHIGLARVGAHIHWHNIRYSFY